MAREIAPALGLASFSCPYPSCRAIAHQAWHRAFLCSYDDGGVPWIPDAETRAKFKADKTITPGIFEFFEKVARREVFFEHHSQQKWLSTEIMNVNISQCYSSTELPCGVPMN